MFDDEDNDDDRDLTPIEIGRFSRIEHLLAVGQLERAEELAVEQIAAEPDNPDSYLSLARVHLYRDEPQRAVAASEQAVTLAPDYSYAWSLHAAGLMHAGRFAESETSLLQALELDPESSSLFEMYAKLLAHCGKPKEALDWAQRALEQDPGSESAHQMFAQLLHSVRPSEWRLSEEVARRAVSLNPDDPDGYAVLGLIVLKRGRLDEAEEYFRSALELDSTNALALEGLAHVVMGRNWFYKPFLSYQLTMMRLGTSAQLLVVASLWAIVSIIDASLVRGTGASTLLNIGYLAFCVYTWFAQPITRAILRRKYHWL